MPFSTLVVKIPNYLLFGSLAQILLSFLTLKVTFFSYICMSSLLFIICCYQNYRSRIYFEVDFVRNQRRSPFRKQTCRQKEEESGEIYQSRNRKSQEK